ncbi:hypothetical protein Sjap_024757 [Stephania japonica]|uniref:Ribosome production factor 2 homolog n=1 Tax=Stephania japonica TaxID=461633 RepID=A0AAP0EG57_9MAGN
MQTPKGLKLNAQTLILLKRSTTTSRAQRKANSQIRFTLLKFNLRHRRDGAKCSSYWFVRRIVKHENLTSIIRAIVDMFCVGNADFPAILTMLQIKTPKTAKAKRELDKRAPKLVENAKKTLILQGTKSSSVLNTVLTEIFHLKKGHAIKYSRKNENIRPFESGGETSLEFFSLKTDCSLFVYGSHSKKRPNNLVLGRTYDHHIYDLVESGVKAVLCFHWRGFENVEELKHLKEVLLDLFRGEVVENLNLAGLDRVFVCTTISSNRVLFMHCAMRLKRSGTVVPRMELVEVGPSMDLVVRRHRIPNDRLRKEAMTTAADQPKKKVKNVSRDAIQGKIGKIYMPDQKVGGMALTSKVKGLKRERREGKTKNQVDSHEPKKQKVDTE